MSGFIYGLQFGNEQTVANDYQRNCPCLPQNVSQTLRPFRHCLWWGFWHWMVVSSANSWWCWNCVCWGPVSRKCGFWFSLSGTCLSVYWISSCRLTATVWDWRSSREWREWCCNPWKTFVHSLCPGGWVHCVLPKRWHHPWFCSVCIPTEVSV